MSETYDPQEHRTLVAAAGGQTWKFFSVNKLLCDLADAGVVNLTKAYEEPGGTDNIWLDLSDPEVEGGTPKAWDGIGWTTLTPQLFYQHIAGGSTGYVTDLEMQAYVAGLIGISLQAYDSDLAAIAALSTTAFGLSLLELADASAARAALGVAIGSDVQAYDADLAALAANATDGLWCHTGAGTGAARTLTAPAAGLTITNPAGIAGSPTFALANDLAALEALSGTNTIYYRSAADTWTAVSIGGLLSFSGGTLNVGDAELTAIGGLTSAADKVPYFTGSGTASTADFTASGRAMAGAASAAAQTALLSNFVGDSGAGGTKGLVPAPAAGDSTKFLKGNGSWASIPGGGDALTSSPLSQFAATTSAQLRGVLSDETGTGAAYFQGGDLGTPSAGVLTNATGLPVGGLAAIAANSVIGNATGSSAVPTAVSATTLQGLMTAPTVQVFTSSGTWTKPTGCRFVNVRLTGGGAGGAGATAAASQCCCGSGGGSGGYGEGFYDVTSTSTVSVTIGAAGSGGAAANGTGGNGGTTSFGALLSANGGTGGSAMASGTAVAYVTAQASAAAGSGGSINAGGNAAGYGVRDSGTVFMSGAGAPSHFGGAGRGTNFASVGAAGGAPGAGGSGAASSSTSGFAGGAGAGGIVIVEEFY